MSETLVYKPPMRPPEVFDKGVFSVFLAGSIEMGRARDWQTEVADFLTGSGHAERFVLFNPRRDDWDSSWEQKREHPAFYEQVTWEMDMLERSDAILFYFAPGTKSPISLLELGLHAASGKVIVCCPDGFWRKGNVDIVCERYKIPVTTDLEEALIGVLGVANGAPMEALFA